MAFIMINNLLRPSFFQEGKDVNLNRSKTRLASKYGLETSPRLVDIIAAVPSEYKKV